MTIYKEIEYYLATGDASPSFVKRLIEALRKRDTELLKKEYQLQFIRDILDD